MTTTINTVLNNQDFLEIFKRLPLQDRLIAELVCKRWKSACDYLWQTNQQLDGSHEDFVEKITGHIHFSLFEVVLKKSFQFITKINFSCTPNYSYKQTLMDDDYYYSRHPTVDFCKMKKGDPQHLESILSVCSNIRELKLDSAIIKCDDECLSELFKRNKKIRALELVDYKLKGHCFSQLSYKYLESLVLFTCLIDNAQFKAHGKNPPKVKSLSVRHSMINHKEILQFITDSLQQLDLSVDMLLAQHHEYSLGLAKLIDTPSILKNLKVLRLSDVIDVNDHTLHLIAVSCSELIALDVGYCCDISDQGLQNLAPLKKLKCLQIDGLDVSSDIFLHLNPSIRVLTAIGLDDITSLVVAKMIQRMEVLEKLVLDLACTEEYSEFVENLVDEIDEVGIKERDVVLRLGILEDGFTPDARLEILNTPCPAFLKLFMFKNHSEWPFKNYL
ncbi:hypothetical protein QAD02_011682 [Eretmocerus hayati]|uniref:Uncharacterized protein n=1 Tax=Eretmocerus hayati TaxID=131215 RepID=A0ACC2NZ86_9HYME|nr:hypothetical protein QAD02_011682 [Eretmocerus hayati]